MVDLKRNLVRDHADGAIEQQKVGTMFRMNTAESVGDLVSIRTARIWRLFAGRSWQVCPRIERILRFRILLTILERITQSVCHAGRLSNRPQYRAGEARSDLIPVDEVVATYAAIAQNAGKIRATTGMNASLSKDLLTAVVCWTPKYGNGRLAVSVRLADRRKDTAETNGLGDADLPQIVLALHGASCRARTKCRRQQQGQQQTDDDDDDQHFNDSHSVTTLMHIVQIAPTVSAKGFSDGCFSPEQLLYSINGTVTGR